VLGDVDLYAATYIPSQLIMVSHDRLAQYWEVCSSYSSKGVNVIGKLTVNQAFGHISFCVSHLVTDPELC